MKKPIGLAALISLLTVSTVVAASNQSTQHLSLTVPVNSSVEAETQKIEENLESKNFTLVSTKGDLETNLKELGLNYELKTQETSSNKLSNYASFITKQRNYSYNSSLSDEDKLETAILNKLNLPEKPIEPSLQLVANEFTISEGSNGYKIINSQDLVTSILSTLENDSSNSVSVILEEQTPLVSEEQLNEQKEKLSTFKTTKLTLQTENLFEKDITVTNKDLSLDFNQGLRISDLYFEELLTELRQRLEKEKQDFIINSINPETNEIEAEGDLINGKSIDSDGLRTNINEAIQSGTTLINLPIQIEEASIINNHNNQEFSLLGSGISNYSGSGAGRVHNIQFASDERYKTIYIPQGETFKFNSYLGGPVTISRGWRNAYVISGGEIVPAPGGGICQMSTTFYRAALNAGLQIDRASNHSLYVHYYAAYGDGLDAAIFPGSKDLHFTNNTPSDIILHSYYDAETQDLMVNILGKDDGRKTELFGPFTAGDNNDNPFDLTTRTNQINWVRQITDSKGEQTQETFTSTYSKFYRY